MAISAGDVIPLSQARANLSELADQVKAGAEKIITKNGESYVAIIDAHRLDYYHQLERERIHLREQLVSARTRVATASDTFDADMRELVKQIGQMRPPPAPARRRRAPSRRARRRPGPP